MASRASDLDREFLAGLITPRVPRWLGEEVWDMLRRVAGVEDDQLLKEDLLYGLEERCLNEVHGAWQGLNYEARLSWNDGFRFRVAAKGERAQERLRRFQPLEEAVDRELKRLIPIYRPYRLAEGSEQRLRPSLLAEGVR